MFRRLMMRLGVCLAIACSLLLASCTTPGRGQHRYRFSTSRYVQPDYAAWKRIVDGMTEAQVLDILGPPIEQWGPNSDDPKEGYSKTYGIVVHSSEKVPKDLAFVLWFRNGKVFGKDDPFNGVFSTDGKPTIPVLIYPRNGQVFDHYPRIVDFRWYPSSGKYPMRYEVQAMGKEWSDQGQGTKYYTYRVAEPHYVRSLGGAGDWRWRVKAVNDLGESEWSEFWHLKSKK